MSTVTEREPRHRRKKGAKKFKIEGRYIGPPDGFAATIGQGWMAVGSYETERDRQTALRAYRAKDSWWARNHEYREAAE